MTLDVLERNVLVFDHGTSISWYEYLLLLTLFAFFRLTIEAEYLFSILFRRVIKFYDVICIRLVSGDHLWFIVS